MLQRGQDSQDGTFRTGQSRQCSWERQPDQKCGTIWQEEDNQNWTTTNGGQEYQPILIAFFLSIPPATNPIPSCLSIPLSIYPSLLIVTSFHLSIHPSFRLSIHPSIYPSLLLSVYSFSLYSSLLPSVPPSLHSSFHLFRLIIQQRPIIGI